MDDDTVDAVKPFLDHLEDLRRTLLWSLAALAVGMVVALPLAPTILRLLKAPLAHPAVGRDPDTFLLVLEVMGGLAIAVRVTILSGLLIAAPVIVWIIGSFIFPGLRQTERRAALGGGLFAAGLFAGGVALGYRLALPQALRIMFMINDWMEIPTQEVLVTDYVSFVLKLLIAFGLIFEMPVVILLLGHLGLVNSRQLREKRRYVIVILFVVAMILTPPDPFTQFIMAVPMTVLYEMCIWLLWLKERRRQADRIY